MSLRWKLTWAFLMVTLVALLPAALVLNGGLYMSTMMGGQGRGQMLRRGPGMHQMEMGSAAEYMQLVRGWSAWASLAAIAIAGGAGLWTAGRITGSLRHLRDATRQLGLRDLSLRVPEEGKDEIAELAGAFNRMAERLEAEERSRRHLLADVAHELRHPLAVMKGRLDLIQDGRAPADPEAVLLLQDEVIRLTRLVGDLRDLSLAEVGQLSLRLSRVRLDSLLEGLLDNLAPVAEARGIHLGTEVQPAELVADGDRLRQVLINLIANALQYTPEGGQVLVQAGLEGAQAVIAVSDTGPGIALADLPHIFDRFYRADKSRTRATGGTGLGLAIVRSLVELHGGTVEAANQPEGGARFVIRLPKTNPGGAPDA